MLRILTAIAIGYAWAANAYLPTIGHLERMLRQQQLAQPIDMTLVAPHKKARKYMTFRRSL